MPLPLLKQILHNTMRDTGSDRLTVYFRFRVPESPSSAPWTGPPSDSVGCASATAGSPASSPAARPHPRQRAAEELKRSGEKAEDSGCMDMRLACVTG